MNAIDLSTATSAVSSQVRRGASRVFLEPVVDLERTRSRPKLVGALIGIIALSAAFISQNIRMVPSISEASQEEVTQGERGAVDTQAREAGAMQVDVATAS